MALIQGKTRNGLRFSLSLGERAGVRAGNIDLDERLFLGFLLR
jgi:hypothetical protein